eukprot:scaffold50045_cov57-Phaeocystis_antarctica.AAC.3
MPAEMSVCTYVCVMSFSGSPRVPDAEVLSTDANLDFFSRRKLDDLRRGRSRASTVTVDANLDGYRRRKSRAESLRFSANP